MYGTYERLNVHVHASNLALLRAARMKLRPDVRTSREHREARHKFYREMMKYHADARELVRYFRLL
jgi:hypothetical protein